MALSVNAIGEIFFIVLEGLSSFDIISVVDGHIEEMLGAD